MYSNYGVYPIPPTHVRIVSGGNEIAYMQQFLIDRGFLEGSADGIYGPETAEAIRKLQNYYGFEENGIIDHNTLLHVYYNTAPFGWSDNVPGLDLSSIPNGKSISDLYPIPDAKSISD